MVKEDGAWPKHRSFPLIVANSRIGQRLATLRASSYYYSKLRRPNSSPSFAATIRGRQANLGVAPVPEMKAFRLGDKTIVHQRIEPHGL